MIYPESPNAYIETDESTDDAFDGRGAVYRPVPGSNDEVFADPRDAAHVARGQALLFAPESPRVRRISLHRTLMDSKQVNL